MTLAVGHSADLDMQQPFRNTILNQLSYDCRHTKDEESEHCLSKSASAKKDTHPLAKHVVGAMFEQYMEIVIEDETKRTGNYIFWMTCFYTYTQSESETWTKILNPLLDSLSEGDDAAKDQKVKLYLGYVVEHFNSPMHHLVANMTASLQDYGKDDVYGSKCEKDYFDDDLSTEAKAMFLLMAKLAHDETSLTLGEWLRVSISLELFSDLPARIEFRKRFAGLRTQIATGMENLVVADNITTSEIMSYLQLGFRTGKMPDKEVIHGHYKETLQVAKYYMQPLWSKMTEKAKLRDLNDMLKGINDAYGQLKPQDYRNFFPALLHCSYGGDDNSKLCQSPVATFTRTGLGYTFNTESFFKLYKKGTSLETFCQEINERTHRTNCTTDTFESNVAQIEGNGPEFSMRLLLNTPEWSRNSWHVQKLAIHPPGSIAADFIEPSPGMLTTVVISPHETITDESLLQQDMSVRGCHSQGKDGNPLKVHAKYTRDNCVFECHMQKSLEKCGCSPWTFPKLNEDVQICSHNETTCFSEEMKLAKKTEKCPDCLEECNRVKYEYTVHTSPLKDICKDNEVIKDAVNKEIPVLYNFLPHSYIMQELGLENHISNQCYFYAKRNVAVVDIQIGPSTIIRTTRTVRVTLVELLANIGKSSKRTTSE